MAVDGGPDKGFAIFEIAVDRARGETDPPRHLIRPGVEVVLGEELDHRIQHRVLVAVPPRCTTVSRAEGMAGGDGHRADPEDRGRRSALTRCLHGPLSTTAGDDLVSVASEVFPRVVEEGE